MTTGTQAKSYPQSVRERRVRSVRSICLAYG